MPRPLTISTTPTHHPLGGIVGGDVQEPELCGNVQAVQALAVQDVWIGIVPHQDYHHWQVALPGEQETLGLATSRD